MELKNPVTQLENSMESLTSKMNKVEEIFSDLENSGYRQNK